MKRHLMVWALCCALASYASMAYADTMTVDADRFELYQDKQRAEFYGHVVVHRQDMVLKADKVLIWYQEIAGKQELKSLHATGHVVIHTKAKQASADKATFEAGSDMLILTGDAQVKDENSVLEGEIIEYNTTTENMKVLKGKSGKQVTFTFSEESK